MSDFTCPSEIRCFYPNASNNGCNHVFKQLEKSLSNCYHMNDHLFFPISLAMHTIATNETIFKLNNY